MTDPYDVIVVGLGAMGSAAAWRLARRGLRVLAFDSYAPPHTLGSTHGRSRIIREAYFEHPSYVPFIRRAYELWGETEREAGERLFLQTGGLMIGRPDGEIVSGALASAREYDIEHELLSAEEVRRRYPVLVPGRDMIGVLEKRAGVLKPELCVHSQLRLAMDAGAGLRLNERVDGWEVDGAGVAVSTASGAVHHAGRLVLAAGPWVSELLQESTVPLEVERQLMFWFDPLQSAGFAPEECPIALWDEPDGPAFATFPDLGEGVKIAIHHHGETTSVHDVDRTPRPANEAAARKLLARFLPAANGTLREAMVCLYTNTPDRHFIIDYLDESRRVVLASPCSGHGFKFASAVGEAVAALVADEPPPVDISLFRLDRFGRAPAGRQSN
ncbi:N-methyl-L-tryptophan oxidase [soil metagenome]